mgnify:CR=1 FL=1
MTSLKRYQRQMSAVVAGGDPALLAEHCADPSDTWRAAVYRNTYAAGCSEVLEANYPAVTALVGPAYFRALAQAYVEKHPPTRRSLVGYGAHMPDFLRVFPPVADLPYLPAAADLDRAWLAAHVAADAAPITPDEVAALEQDDSLSAAVLGLHPSVQRVTLDWTMYSLWAALRAGETPDEVALQLRRAEETVLVWRPGLDVRHRQLTRAEAAFLSAVEGGVQVGHAAAAAMAAQADADLAVLFAQLLQDGVLTGPTAAPDDKPFIDRDTG